MHIPIIALSSFGELSEKVRAFEIGVDDYITKPFQVDELLARIRTQIRRIQQNYLSPLIGLPGGLQVELAIKQKLNSQEPWSILYLDLDNFKAFNDVYGFLTGNDVIRLVGRICQRVVREYGNADDFVGHIGGDDFVVVTTPDHAGLLCKQISSAYKEESAAYYRPEDLRRGSISGVDRKGRIYQFPLVSLSIGVVNNQGRRSHSLEEVSYLAAEAKYYAKQSTSNVYHISPRRDVISTGRSISYPTTPPYLPPLSDKYAPGNAYSETDYYSPVEVMNRAEYEQRV
jgi:diguanylate cyclase (GGDEF)-like protein